MVYWLRKTAHDQEVMGLNPSTVYWTGVSDATSYYIHMKITKIKVAKWGTPKKSLKRYVHANGLNSEMGWGIASFKDNFSSGDQKINHN